MSATNDSAQASKSNPKPKFRCQFGPISVAVLARSATDPSGKEFMSTDFVLQKSWKDKDEKWQDRSLSLKRRELNAVKVALDRAFAASFDLSDSSEEE